MADGCKDQEAYNHPSATSHQRLTTTVVLDDIETEEGATKVDAVENHLSDKRLDLDTFEDGSTCFGQ